MWKLIVFARFLKHPYPRVRHFLAEQLYLALLSIDISACLPNMPDDALEMQSQLSEYITEIDWFVPYPFDESFCLIIFTNNLG